MSEKRKKYDREFREGAVRIVRETGKSIAQVARDLGIHEGTLGNWVAQDREAREGRGELTRVPSRGLLSGKGTQTGTSGTRAGTCAWPPPRIDAYSSLIPATRRESSRTYRKYEVPNHVVTQNDWQPPRRVENPRPKSGRSPVRSRPWPKSWPTLALALASLGTVVAAVVRW